MSKGILSDEVSGSVLIRSLSLSHPVQYMYSLNHICIDIVATVKIGYTSTKEPKTVHILKAHMHGDFRKKVLDFPKKESRWLYTCL